MLVLSRGKNETILIGDDIVVTVADVNKNGTVKIGIDAPKEVSVHRREVYDAIRRQGGRRRKGGGEGEADDS